MEHEITLTYAGQLAAEAGVAEEVIQVSSETPLLEVLRAAAMRHGGTFAHLLFDDDSHLRRALVISVNAIQAAEPVNVSLTQDCEIFVMTPIAGG